MAFDDFLNDTNLVNQAKKIPQIGVVNFTVFTSAILDDPDNEESPNNINYNELSTDVIGIEFQAMNGFYYKSQINVPYEPLEDGLFSSDSLLGTPYMIAVTATCAPAYNNNSADVIITNDDDRRQYIAEVIDQLDTAQNTAQLLVLLSTTPVFKTYSNLKLISFEYELSANQLNLEVIMQFQQIRMTNSEYDTSTIKTTRTPSYANQITNGSVQTQPPSSGTLSQVTP